MLYSDYSILIVMAQQSSHFRINCCDTPFHCISSNKTLISYTFRHNLIAHVIMKKTPQNYSMDIDSPCWLGEIGSI